MSAEREDLILVAQTDKAILVRDEDVDEEDAEDGEDQWWIPRSLIEDTDMENIGDKGYVVVPTWFADKEGLSV